jgi:hypothetical protein
VHWHGKSRCDQDSTNALVMKMLLSLGSGAPNSWKFCQAMSNWNLCFRSVLGRFPACLTLLLQVQLQQHRVLSEVVVALSLVASSSADSPRPRSVPHPMLPCLQAAIFVWDSCTQLHHLAWAPAAMKVEMSKCQELYRNG